MNNTCAVHGIYYESCCPKCYPQLTQRFSTFKERNDLLNQWLKLSIKNRDIIALKTISAYSVTSIVDPIFWVHFEKYMKDLASQQPSLFQDVRGNKIDDFTETIHKKLDKPIGGHID